MMINKFLGKKSALTILVSLLVALVSPTQAGTLYRWQDEDGKKHIGTLIPPESSQLGYEVLDSSTLRVIEVVPPPYTEDQLEDRRKEEEAIVEARKQELARKRADKTLVDTYLNVDNMLMARDGQLSTLNSIIESIRNTIQRLNNNLDQQMNSAASYERDGKKVPQNLFENIKNSKAQILDQQRTIEEHRIKQEAIRERFARDIERFKELSGEI